MNVLFIHDNFPGQFRHLAPLIAESEENKVVFLTSRDDVDPLILPKVKIQRYEQHRLPNKNGHHYLLSTEEAILKGQAVLRGIEDLINKGFNPRIVITHAGMGLGLFIKDLLPDTLHVGYFEWYFLPETTRYLVKDFDFDTQLRTGLRNLPIIQELDKCDQAVVPTAWQKQQFPKAYQSKLTEIFDGIDLNYFKPQNVEERNRSGSLLLTNRESKDKFEISADARIISYATRGMEPLRGFPEFMRALPYLLERFENLKVVIAGSDRRAYSYDAPNESGSWKQYLLEELESKLDIKRLLFTGLLNYNDYRSLLWRSDLHCYFTRPYVTSWSLFEAAACGARLAVNKSMATNGIINPKTVTWVDLENQTQLSKDLAKALENPDRNSVLMPQFDLESGLQQWQKLLNIGLQGRQ